MAQPCAALRRGRGHELVQMFVLSYEHGVQKPDPALFQMALDALGRTGRERLMVSDNARADGGATALGCAFHHVAPVTVDERPRRSHRDPRHARLSARRGWYLYFGGSSTLTSVVRCDEPRPSPLRWRSPVEREKTVQQIAELFGVPRTTVYNRLKTTQRKAA